MFNIAASSSRNHIVITSKLQRGAIMFFIISLFEYITRRPQTVGLNTSTVAQSISRLEELLSYITAHHHNSCSTML
jgi:hypothetical protein